MQSTFVTTERRDSLQIIQLNRPEKLNTLAPEMILALIDTFKRIDKESGLRVVILTGAGEAFCAGTDIAELAATTDHDRAREISERGQALCNQIENCSVPVLAAVNGIAAGGGCELALACHLRIAATKAQFSLPETKLGVVPAYGGTRRLAGELGNGRALEIMLTGRAVSAEQALQFGLINRLTTAPDLMKEAESLASEIAKLAPLAIRACLQAVIKGGELPLAEGLRLEAELFASLFTTEDALEGTRAFLEKRQPIFKGK
ncbi:MAG TPA: enoyl-CoA hydratase/isomerase family protein [Pyrinomonadaceae bacterium]|nr:enoyl-CoA hydratase/isomerase family protein [Pyrinomonadaceae bacterium]